MARTGSRPANRRPAYGERRVLEVLPKNIPDLTFGAVMGSGHFSHVYRGTYQGKPVAIKVIERGNEDLINNEIDLLTKLSGVPHIVQLLRVITEPQCMLIFELINSVDPDVFVEELQIDVLRDMLHSILLALDGAHSRGIVHRDVKFGNILINPDFSDELLLDRGCASGIGPSMGSHAGSRMCRSPEMLLGYRNYATKGDIWAFGVLIFYFFTDGETLWRSRVNDEVVKKMVHYFDREKIEALAQKLGLLMIEIGDDVGPMADRALEDEISSEFRDLAIPPLLDLMKACFAIDPDERPEASQLLRHPFFEGPVRVGKY
jgi:serine/threonine protein kinase